MDFKRLIKDVSGERGSNVILALDLPLKVGPRDLAAKSTELLKKVSPYICAAKINRQTSIVLPYEELKALVKRVHDLGMPAIMDCKLNDVGHTNIAITKRYFDAGFDAITASPFIGWKGGLEPILDLARCSEKGVLLLVFMSHKGSVEGYGQMVVDPKTRKPVPQYELIARRAVEWKADGAVVGATYPEKISEIHTILGDDVPIYSPGIGPQGGVIEKSIEAGTAYLIVGRSITLSPDPAKAALLIRDRARKALKPS